MDLAAQFNGALEKVKHLSSKPANDKLLQLYAYYKQGFVGDITGDRPDGFDFKAIAKFDAWTSLKGFSKEEAMQKYIDLVDRLIASDQ